MFKTSTFLIESWLLFMLFKLYILTVVVVFSSSPLNYHNKKHVVLNFYFKSFIHLHTC